MYIKIDDFCKIYFKNYIFISYKENDNQYKGYKYESTWILNKVNLLD